MRNSPNSHPKHPAAQAMGYITATVKTVVGTTCNLDIGGVDYASDIATHVLSVLPGQRVAVLDAGPDVGYLVIAAWPLDSQKLAPLNFDPATGTLHIQAAKLNLAALAAIELQCGEAILRLTLDGKVHIEGNEVLSAAVGSNRIEGASIDLN